jgi:hypothetical protein
VVVVERVARRGSEVVHGGWFDALVGGLRELIRVKTCFWLMAGAGDGGAFGTIPFLKVSSRWSFLPSFRLLRGKPLIC